MKMPYGNAAKVEQVTRKVVTYSLNTTHPRGRHKAILFESKLGITLENKQILISLLLDQAMNGEATYNGTTPYGESYAIDFAVTTSKGTSVVRSAWIIRPQEVYPDLVSTYPIRKKEKFV